MKRDKAIKEQIDFEPSSSKADKELYELLFDQLETEKDISIRPSFSNVVMEKLRQKHKREARKDSLMFTMAIIGVLIFSFGALKVISTFGEGKTFISFGTLLPVLGLAALIATFQLIDHNLVKKRKIKRHFGA